MSDYHKLIIRSTTEEDKQFAKTDKAMGEGIVARIQQMEGKAPAAQAHIAGEQDLTAAQRAMLPYVIAMKANCFLCNTPPPNAGMYTWMQAGELVVTPICLHCSRIIGVRDIIKKQLSEGLQ